MATSITIYGIQFESLKRATTFLRHLISKNKDKDIPKGTKLFNFVYSLLERHPNFQEKKQHGIAKFTVRQDEFRNYCFYIVNDQNEMLDFSWVICLKQKETTPQAKIRMAMREAVKEQIFAFKKYALEYEPICSLCGCQLTKNNCHIDHIIYFEDIVTTFLKEHSIFPTSFDGETTYNFKVEDEPFAEKWKAYHYKNCQLRATCSKCNLCRPKPCKK